MFRLLFLGNVLGRLRWNLVCTWEPISYSFCSSHGCGISARAHVHTVLLYLTNGSADCVQIWPVGFESLPKCFPQAMVSLHVRTCRPRFCISGTAWPIEFNFGVWVGGSWTRCLTQLMGGVSLHVRTCTPRFCISGTAWPIVFKFDMWVGGHKVRAFHRSWVGWGIFARAHVHPRVPIAYMVKIKNGYFLTALGGILCGNGKTSHTKFEANRFTFRGSASDLNLHFVYFYILCPSLGFLS